MMRNLPNKYTQRMLLSEVNQAGFLGTFDFMYLPIDPDTNANRGYAFLNFIDPGFAWMLKMTYEGQKMNRFNSLKVVSVVPATLQGFDANYAHYSSARVNRGDPAARPLFLRQPSQPQGAGVKPKGKGRRDRDNGPKSMMEPLLPAAPAAMVAPMQQLRTPWPADGGYVGFDGANQGPRGGAPAAPQEPPDQKMVPKFCPHCGGPIQPRFQFCPHCGNGITFGQ
jgi:hypothetical protein